MVCFETQISGAAVKFFQENKSVLLKYLEANSLIRAVCGINNFFLTQEEATELLRKTKKYHSAAAEPDRAEYGDFQTNSDLANHVTLHLVSKNISPEILVEPTCGKGNFIIASLRNFKSIKYIFGVEIYYPYAWEAKFNILDYFLTHPKQKKPEIFIAHCSVFDFDFQEIAKKYSSKDILIIGNPPWVTNSKLGSLNSANLPKKSNFKNLSGLDAMTGKGNFDIAESISLTMIETFQKMHGHLVLLVKNSVVKNIVFDQNQARYNIGTLEKYCIDSKKEFNVSVEASLFYCEFNVNPEFDCREFNFYSNQNSYLKFGWLGGKFVSNIDTYIHTKDIDGHCPFVWRQGVKHDCSSIMELDKVNGHYVNGMNEEIKLEEGLVYGILKSSDLKNTVIKQTRKFTIVTQKKVGQETQYIKTKYPKTYKYLTSHKSSFEARKSSIYVNKPAFSIFGIGDYSFKPFKVAISGLYKTFHFTLILPQNSKPVMLDDTCYLIGFDKIEFAVYALILLNSPSTVQFLRSVTFPDAKRTFTKDILMRLDLLQLAKHMNKEDLKSELTTLNKKYGFDLSLGLWDSFIKEMTPVSTGQIEMFVS